ncbi:NAD(P)-dependent alcohol dehydrogenase [Streptomyces dioscori]|uniref:NAD(P)-dependent alcohol dehydrogenase n=1 Tax=Streptomyces dioscori TaxID=2109333 RepID=A0A2P8Q2B5_9ACTN|nr:NAD(P)-dependent alcohol dehydrogenase [Streptomyces dioscori]PSM40397.1 NAD(P)-dependent alcohol dehydrogenase [Streptomyces dioscori]
MKRWILPAGVIEASGLVLEEANVPEPGRGEVRIKVEAASINYRDQLILTNWYGRTEGRNLIPLSDVAGTVDAIGEGADAWAVGDRVTNTGVRGWEDGVPVDDLGLGLGALDLDGVLAEYIVLPADHLARAPQNLDAAEASTLPIAGGTAWNAMFADHPIGKGGSMLTLGTGGVALFAVQLCVAVGADAHVVVRRSDHVEKLRDMGVVDVVNSVNTPDWAAEVARSTGGVRKVVDTLGMGILPQAMEAVGKTGEIASVGLFELDTKPLSRSLLAKQINLRGVAGASRRMHHNMVEFIENRDLHPIIHQRYEFGDVPAAYLAQAASGIFGKIVIEMPS